MRAHSVNKDVKSSANVAYTSSVKIQVSGRRIATMSAILESPLRPTFTDVGLLRLTNSTALFDVRLAEFCELAFRILPMDCWIAAHPNFSQPVIVEQRDFQIKLKIGVPIASLSPRTTSPFSRSELNT